MELIYWDNEYYSNDEIKEQFKALKLEFAELSNKYRDLVQKNETLTAEFEQLKERYINLAK